MSNIGIIRIHDLRAASLVGIYERERAVRQPVVIHIELSCDMLPAIGSDNFLDAVDYEALANNAVATAEKSAFLLLESLCAAILAGVLSVPGVLRATVRVQKPEAIPAARAVEVELSGLGHGVGAAEGR